ncbi:hypothetical protein ACFL2G_02795 [Candidatus Omnitrophota bacterium]
MKKTNKKINIIALIFTLIVLLCSNLSYALSADFSNRLRVPLADKNTQKNRLGKMIIKLLEFLAPVATLQIRSEYLANIYLADDTDPDGKNLLLEQHKITGLEFVVCLQEFSEELARRFELIELRNMAKGDFERSVKKIKRKKITIPPILEEHLSSPFNVTYIDFLQQVSKNKEFQEFFEMFDLLGPAPFYIAIRRAMRLRKPDITYEYLLSDSIISKIHTGFRSLIANL